MATRREISGNYRMELTALEDCKECNGTGISLEQTHYKISGKLELNLKICPCLRIIPRLVAGARIHFMENSNV